MLYIALKPTELPRVLVKKDSSHKFKNHGIHLDYLFIKDFLDTAVDSTEFGNVVHGLAFSFCLQLPQEFRRRLHEGCQVTAVKGTCARLASSLTCLRGLPQCGYLQCIFGR